MGVSVIEKASLYVLYASSFFIIAMLTVDIGSSHAIYHQVVDFFLGYSDRPARADITQVPRDIHTN